MCAANLDVAAVPDDHRHADRRRRSAPRSAVSTCPRTSTTTSSPRSVRRGSTHLVVFFRDQVLDSDRFLAAARRIGAPVEYPFVPGIDGYPEIIAVTKLAHETVNFGGIWHSDTAYLDEPPMATMLLAREVPPAGGDTMFANMYAAFEALSPAMQRAARAAAGGQQLGARRRQQDPRGPHPRRWRRGHQDVRGSASGRADAPRDRAQGAVRQRRPHGAVRRDDGGREPAAAAVPLPAPGAAGVHVPIPVGGRVARRCGTTAASSTTRSTTTTAGSG